MTTSNTIVPVLVDKIPEFAKDLYPRFVQFMRDYLEFLERDENFLRIILDWHHNLEPSNKVEPYIDALLKDLGFESGQNLAVDKHLILHLLRDFYLARGSEASFKFLFRALFNEDVSLRYPRDQLLIPSYATYGERHFIFTTATNRETEQYQGLINHIRESGGTVTGLSSGAIASIEDIIIQHGTGTPYLRIEILLPVFEFDINEGVVIEGGAYSIPEVIKPVLDIVVVDPGYGYSRGDHISITGPKLQGQVEIEGTTKGGVTGIIPEGTDWSVGDHIRAFATDEGFGFSAYVTEVVDGKITDYKVTNKGYNYSTIPSIAASSKPVKLKGTSTEIGGIQKVRVLSPYVDFESCEFEIVSGTGTDAILEARPVSRWSYSDWTDRKGFIGVNSTLIDSDKYQQYSYTIVSSISADNYDRFVTEMLHPAGYVKSASYEIVSHIELDLTESDVTVGRVIEIPYDNTLVLEFEAQFDIDTLNLLVTSGGDLIVTDLRDAITIAE